MNVRHRIPSIFNLSMVDVLCCALGCVILLWLFYLRWPSSTRTWPRPSTTRQRPCWIPPAASATTPMP